MFRCQVYSGVPPPSSALMGLTFVSLPRWPVEIFAPEETVWWTETLRKQLTGSGFGALVNGIGTFIKDSREFSWPFPPHSLCPETTVQRNSQAEHATIKRASTTKLQRPTKFLLWWTLISTVFLFPHTELPLLSCYFWGLVITQLVKCLLHNHEHLN